MPGSAINFCFDVKQQLPKFEFATSRVKLILSDRLTTTSSHFVTFLIRLEVLADLRRPRLRVETNISVMPVTRSDVYWPPRNVQLRESISRAPSSDTNIVFPKQNNKT